MKQYSDEPVKYFGDPKDPMTFLPLVRKFSARYKCDRVERADLEQEGILGVMAALNSYDPNQASLLFWVGLHVRGWMGRARARQYVGNLGVARMGFTKAFREKYSVIGKDGISLDEVRDALKTSKAWEGATEWELAQGLTLVMGEWSLGYSQTHEVASGELLQERVPHPHALSDMEQQLDVQGVTEILHKAVSTLTGMRRVVAETRTMLVEEEDRAPLEDLAARFGVTRQRISQIDLEMREFLKQALIEGGWSPEGQRRT